MLKQNMPAEVAAAYEKASKRRSSDAVLIDIIFETLAPVIKDLRGRVSELEARPEFVDKGVFREGNAYSAGHGVTHDGSYWLAQRATMARPGSNADWRLAVKRGRDGKDSRK